MDESEKAKMVGEAKFLRAFYYLSLVDKFGGVPLIIDAPNADEQAELPRNSKEEVVPLPCYRTPMLAQTWDVRQKVLR